MKLLVVTAERITAQHLASALGDDLDPHDAEVMVVAPALQSSPLKFWFSDTDEAIARAEQIRQESLQQLGQEGVQASGDTGESDPLQAIEDALTTFPADRIVLFTREGEEQGYREDIDSGLLRERFGVPVDVANVSGSAT